MGEPTDERAVAGGAIPPAHGPRPRPRDVTGRPLPPGQPDQLGDGDPAADCGDADEAIERLDACIGAGRFFPAHRVVLRLWRHLEPEKAGLWGAVAQLTGGCVHLERGNQAGAETLLRRAAGRLAEHQPAHRSVDVAALAAAAQSLADLAATGRGAPGSVLRALPRRR